MCFVLHCTKAQMEPHQVTDGKTWAKTKSSFPDSSCQACCSREPAAAPAVLPSCRYQPQHTQLLCVTQSTEGQAGCSAQLCWPKAEPQSPLVAPGQQEPCPGLWWGTASLECPARAQAAGWQQHQSTQCTEQESRGPGWGGNLCFGKGLQLSCSS